MADWVKCKMRGDKVPDIFVNLDAVYMIECVSGGSILSFMINQDGENGQFAQHRIADTPEEVMGKVRERNA
jgi:hypothetical protein